MHQKPRTRTDSPIRLTKAVESDRTESRDLLRFFGNSPDGPFNELAELASSLCWTTDGFIIVEGSDGMYIRGVSGRFKQLIADRTTCVPFEHSFGWYTMQGEGLLEVEDASLDWRFKNIPSVVNPEHLRFYAGVPFSDPTGRRIGVVCVSDTIPRQLKDWQRQALVLVAHQATAQIALRLFRLGVSWN